MAILAIDVSKSSLSFYSNFIGKGFVDNSPQGIFDLFNKGPEASSDFILVLESTVFILLMLQIISFKIISLSFGLKLTKLMLNSFLILLLNSLIL
ncbi:hypothetical protein HNP65_001415 [Thermosipho japonicus]|uniref:Uncharacterized protein n=1 Tax=Thermosipho japonicus TaxID=90323 RepID=A0A841GH58_9BACT|nr:hypothetical protein [Thermosipho japonicus]MBB6062952.1 hypothetical protein [Thermosipho japonicus]